LRRLVLDGRIEPHDIVLACCLDEEVARLPEIAATLQDRARTSAQPLLQTRILALGLHHAELGDNPHLHPTARALLALDAASRAKLVTPPGRLAALLARVPLLLPEEGYR